VALLPQADSDAARFIRRGSDFIELSPCIRIADIESAKRYKSGPCMERCRHGR